MKLVNSHGEKADMDGDSEFILLAPCPPSSMSNDLDTLEGDIENCAKLLFDLDIGSLPLVGDVLVVF